MNLRRFVPPFVLCLSIGIFLAAVLFATRPGDEAPVRNGPGSPIAAGLRPSPAPQPTALAITLTTPPAVRSPHTATASASPPAPLSPVASPTRSAPAGAPPSAPPVTAAAGVTGGASAAPSPTSPAIADSGTVPTSLPPTPLPPLPPLPPPVPTAVLPPTGPPRAASSPIPSPEPVPSPGPTPTALPVAPTRPPTATPRPAPGPSTIGGALPSVAVGLPVRLLIPGIGVDAAIEQVATDADGNMATPDDPWNTAWFAPGSRPGQPGNAAIAGHVDYSGVGPVVFWDLRTLAPGAEILVVTDGGITLRFVVRDSAYFRPESAPLARVFGPTADVNLNLITCGGTFNPDTRQYDQRLVVFTTFAGSGR